jgi:hypothetical protein
VKVPRPIDPPAAFSGSFDPPRRPIPAGAQNNTGIFTRILTVTNTFEGYSNLGDDITPRAISRIEDSFAPGTTIVPATDQMLPGRPVLPIVSYDVTLQENSLGSGSGIPEPRGVRLKSATILSDLSGFNPHTTTITTDTTAIQQQEDPALAPTIRGEWMPAQPYTFQSTEQQVLGGVRRFDKLIFNPAQFRATDAETGQLRRFARMVFEITYVDPKRATSAMLADSTPPLVQDVTIVSTPASASQGITLAAQSIEIKADVSDPSGIGVANVNAVYTTDGVHWQRVDFQPLGGGIYGATVQSRIAQTNAEVVAVVEARDRAGNVTVQTAKGTLSGTFTTVTLPLIRR